MAKKIEKKEVTKAVARKTESAVSTDVLSQMESDAGIGVGSIGSQDMAIPFLRMMQDMTPEAKKRDPAFIEGGEPGKMFDTVTKELFESVLVVPCAYKRKLNEWTPRKDGGGFHGSIPWNPELAAKFRDKEARTEKGTHYVDTMEFYVLYQSEDGTWKPAVMALSSTQLTVGRRWNSLIKAQVLNGKRGMVPAPIFSTIYKMDSEERTNDDGTWFVWAPSIEGRIDDLTLYQTAKAFNLSVESGTVRVQDPTPEDAASSDDVPF